MMQKTQMKKVAVGVLAAVIFVGGTAFADAKAGASKTKKVKTKKIELSQKKVKTRLAKTQRTNAGLHLKVKGSRRTIPGKITALNSVTVTDAITGTSTVTFDGFTMKKGGTSYTIIVDANTLFKNRKGVVITSDQLAVGHKVSIKGKFLSGSKKQILANSVRDITLPVETTEAD